MNCPYGYEIGDSYNRHSLCNKCSPEAHSACYRKSIMPQRPTECPFGHKLGLDFSLKRDCANIACGSEAYARCARAFADTKGRSRPCPSFVGLESNTDLDGDFVLRWPFFSKELTLSRADAEWLMSRLSEFVQIERVIERQTRRLP